MFLSLSRVFLVVACVSSVGTVEGADRKELSGVWVPNPEKSESVPNRQGASGIEGVTLTIGQRDDVVTLVRQGGSRRNRRVTLKPGAGPLELSSERGTGTVEARWEGDTLVVERTFSFQTPDGEGHSTQHTRWQLSEDGKTLTQKVKVNRRGRDMDYTVVYDKR